MRLFYIPEYVINGVIEMKNKVTISLFLIILIHLSSSCTPIVEQTTLSNTEYEYQIENDIIKITHHRSDFGETKIVVPVEIDGKPVAVLGAETFYQHKNIVSVILPQTLTTILGSPFYRCYALQECNIPANVRQIDANPFFRCSSLTQITVDSSNAYFSAVEGVLFDKGQTTLISYPEGKTNDKYVIPKTVKKLSIDMPETITNVIKCKNPRCITSVENGIDHIFKLSDKEQGTYRCAYCETKAK